MIETVQLPVGGFDDNFSYVVHDSDTGESAVVDPCGDVTKIRAALERLPSRIPKYILLTHGHADHISGLAAVREFFPAKLVSHPDCRTRSELALTDGMKLPFGGSYLQALFSPGHSADSVCWLTGDRSAVFTGDTLFIGCCGYCDPEIMFKTMRKILYPLPDEAVVYSGHDYGEVPADTLGHQKQVNPYLRIDGLAEFKKAVKEL